MLHELLTLMMSDEREFVPQGGPEIGSLIILDRGIISLILETYKRIH